MKLLISILVSLGLALASPVAMSAEPASGQPDVRVVQLQTIYGEAQIRVDRYNSARDGTDLIVARELLMRWLHDHEVLYGNSHEAAALRAPIVQQLRIIDTELMRITTRPAPTPMPATVPLSPAPEPVDPAILVARQEARRVIRGGSTVLTLGMLTIVGASVPLWATRNVALRQAKRQRFRVDQQAFLERARRRQIGAITTLSVGIPLVGLGVALLAVGFTKRGQARRLSFTPRMGPSLTGASVTLRF